MSNTTERFTCRVFVQSKQNQVKGIPTPSISGSVRLDPLEYIVTLEDRSPGIQSDADAGCVYPLKVEEDRMF